MGVPAGPAVVLIREPEDNRELAGLLEASGVPVRQIPCLATRYVEPGALPEQIEAVTFSSRRGVAGLRLSSAGPAWMARLGAAQVGAVGAATAAALDEAGWPADLVADPPLGEELARRLLSSLGAGSRVAVVRGNLRAGGMDAILTGAGLELCPVQVYENVAPEVPQLEPFAVAAVFAASPSAARRLLAANPWMAGQAFVAIGPTTATALSEMGVARIEQAGKQPAVWQATLVAAHRRAVENQTLEHPQEEP